MPFAMVTLAVVTFAMVSSLVFLARRVAIGGTSIMIACVLVGQLPRSNVDEHIYGEV